MKIFGLNITRESKQAISLDTFIQRLEAAYQTSSGISVTPENCMESPTVQAIVTAVSRRIATLPVHVLKKVTSNNRVRKERQPNHPVERLLQRPNDWQSSTSYWFDSTSCLVRYGNFYAFKARGQTGPIRRLLPLQASAVDVTQDDDWTVTYAARMADGSRREFPPSDIHHVRGPSRDFLKGDSPVKDVRESIALEIAAERMGSTVFGNNAAPGLVFKFMEGFAGFKTDEERQQFIEDFQAAYTGSRRHRALLLPSGLDVAQQTDIENEKAQFIETRKHQRNVIAGAFGVPPHLVGDLERGTFSNIEHQSLEFIQSVVLPYVRSFESAMERDLLTDEDRRQGVIIRFNLDGALRGDFKSRQEGLKIQREMGVICPNDWRENENMNPISEEDGGEEYWSQGPSGQGAPAPPEGDGETEEESDDDATP